MLAQHHFSHRELHGKRRDDLHEMLHDIGVNWNDQPEEFKRGTLLHRDADGVWTVGWAPIFTQEQVVLDALSEPAATSEPEPLDHGPLGPDMDAV